MFLLLFAIQSDILRGSIRLIKTHCEYSFTRIERLFKDSNPPSGIGEQLCYQCLHMYCVVCMYYSMCEVV